MTIVEKLAELMANEGIDPGDVQEAFNATNTVQATRATQRAPVGGLEAKSPHQSSQRASKVAGGSQKTRKAKYVYGTSPVEKYANGQPKPSETHNARVDALEAAIPGIEAIACIFSVGRDSNKKNTEDFAYMQNNPWTWVELPGGKNVKIGNMDGPAIRAALALCGYGWSPANGLWATDSHGNPSRRKAHYQAQKVGRAVLDEG